MTATTEKGKGSRTVTLSQLRTAMNAKQKGFLSDAVKARNDEKDQTARAAMKTRLKVKAALEAGVSARVIAAGLGLSVPRIYQMRSEVDQS